MKLKPDVKAAWLEALRGNEYPQGKHQLRSTHRRGIVSYCCLGVLCDLAAQAGVGQWSDIDVFVTGTGGGIHVLPEAVIEWAYEDTTSRVPNDTPANPSVGNSSLASMNDNGVSFGEIADAIERAL